jgi:hypothetical protein
MTGYVLAKLRFPGRNLLFFVIIFTMTLPFQITLIPNYILMVKLQWTDTLAALIVPALNSTFAILLFRQAFQSIPDDLIYAARVDGCGELRIIFQILLSQHHSHHHHRGHHQFYEFLERRALAAHRHPRRATDDHAAIGHFVCRRRQGGGTIGRQAGGGRAAGFAHHTGIFHFPAAFYSEHGIYRLERINYIIASTNSL